MRGMGITSADIAGRVFLFCDFHHALDKKHADCIAQASDSVQLINVPFAKHHVTTVLAGSRNLAHLIQASLDHDMVAIHRINRQAPRRSDIYKRNVLKVAHRKCPHVFVRYLSNKDNRYLFKAKPAFALYYMGHILRRMLPF